VEALLSPEYKWLWSVALGVALFFPVRQVIWVMSVRRAQRREGELPDEKVRDSMKGRAGVTAGLLCLVFAAVYVGVMFGERQ
tara:strand:- start:1409 stop:1654 length:246 start_codon:yes stop_codon:yes gene_type:complete